MTKANGSQHAFVTHAQMSHMHLSAYTAEDDFELSGLSHCLPVSPAGVKVAHCSWDEPQALPAARLAAALKQQLQPQADAKEGLAGLQSTKR
jgi:hypothetical protein